MELSFQEKSILGSLLATILVFGTYLKKILALAQAIEYSSQLYYYRRGV